MTKHMQTSKKPYLHNPLVPFISTPQTWATMAQKAVGYTDEELEQLSYIDDNTVRGQKYIAGDHQKWNKANDREEGDTYIGGCVEIVIMNERREARKQSF